MSIDALSRYFTATDGVNTYTLSFFEANNLNYSTNPLDGGESIIRFMDGGAEKQFNWTKLAISISGSGQIPLGMERLDFRKAITVSMGTTKAVTGNLASVTANLPAHRTDLGYAPTTYSLIEGVYEPYTGFNPSGTYRAEYYPVYTCFFKAPTQSQALDQVSGFSWTLSGEEV